MKRALPMRDDIAGMHPEPVDDDGLQNDTEAPVALAEGIRDR